MKSNKRTCQKFLTIYEWEQHYGGPEEGGWYYTALTPIRSKKILCKKIKAECGYKRYVPVDKNVQKIMDSTGKYGKYHYEGGTTWYIENRQFENTTTTRPHYE